MERPRDIKSTPMCQPMKKTANLGQRFGRLVVTLVPEPGQLHGEYNQPVHPTLREVKCDCGGTTAANGLVFASELEAYTRLSCGCLRKDKRPRKGAKFGSLTLVESVRGQLGVNLFQCDCGKYCRALVKLVRTGEVTRCPDCAARNRGKGLSFWDRVYFEQVSIADHARGQNTTIRETLKTLQAYSEAGK